jgi:hypothetical protein
VNDCDYYSLIQRRRNERHRRDRGAGLDRRSFRRAVQAGQNDLDQAVLPVDDVRCGWAEKPDQECVLAVEITRDGFEWALAHASLSHFDRDQHHDQATWARLLKSSPARVQWDPERSLQLQPLPYRSLQLGLQGEAVDRYIDEWTVTITDVTPLAHKIHDLIRAGDQQTAASLLPAERIYPLPEQIGTAIGPVLCDPDRTTGRG